MTELRIVLFTTDLTAFPYVKSWVFLPDPKYSGEIDDNKHTKFIKLNFIKSPEYEGPFSIMYYLRDSLYIANAS